MELRNTIFIYNLEIVPDSSGWRKPSTVYANGHGLQAAIKQWVNEHGPMDGVYPLRAVSWLDGLMTTKDYAVEVRTPAVPKEITIFDEGGKRVF